MCIYFLDTLVLGKFFTLLWENFCVLGAITIEDIEGNEFLIELSKKLEEVLVLSIGVFDMGKFYGIETKFDVWLHYMGGNRFGIKIFIIADVEIGYPIIIGNRDSPQSQDLAKDIEI